MATLTNQREARGEAASERGRRGICPESPSSLQPAAHCGGRFPRELGTFRPYLGTLWGPHLGHSTWAAASSLPECPGQGLQCSQGSVAFRVQAEPWAHPDVP